MTINLNGLSYRVSIADCGIVEVYRDFGIRESDKEIIKEVLGKWLNSYHDQENNK